MAEGRQYDVCGVGNALVDLVVEVKDDFLARYGINKGVMTLIDDGKLHDLMLAIEDYPVTVAAGGSAANTMVGVAQLGGRSAYSFVTAKDGMGRAFIEDMERQGIALSMCYDDCPEGCSGRCLVWVTPDAERTMNTFLGASATMAAQHVSKPFIEKSRYLYLEGYLSASSLGFEAMKFAVQWARRSGTLVALTLSDPTIVNFCSSQLREVIGEGIDLLFCNEQEALAFTGRADLSQACDVLSSIARQVAVTRGALGSVIYDGGAWIEVAAHPVVLRVVDTVGAGDIFAGGFLYGVSHGYSCEQSARIASLMAAHVVAQIGPRLTAPNKVKALEDLRKQSFGVMELSS